MKYKLLFALILLIISLSVVYAEDNQTIQSASFNNLQDLIDNSPEYSEISLTQDYSEGYAPVHIDKSITIDGQGHSIDGQNTHNLITSSKGFVTLKNINFKNGNIKDETGGAIDVRGTSYVLIINCTFTNNHAYRGGAIYNQGESVVVRNSTFIKNSATEDYGGAILTCSDLIVDSCIFEENAAAKCGGAIFNSFTPLGVAYVANSYFYSNTADECGGAISNSGELTIGNCSFVKNSVSSYGGAIWSNRWLSFSNIGSNFTENKAIFGGAIYAYSFENYARNLIFKNNRASSDGGAVMLYVHASIEYVSNYYFKDCIFDSNQCVEDSIFYNGYGGAIYMEVDAGSSRPSELKIDGCEFLSNKAYDDGGAIYIADEDNKVIFVGAPSYFNANEASTSGGALYSKGLVSFDNSGTIFKANRAESKGGAIYCSYKVEFNNNNDLRFIDNDCDGDGGAIYTEYLFYLKNAIFITNHADGDGGAVYVNKGYTVNVESCYFEKNNCGDEGGAIYLDSMSSTILLSYNIFYQYDVSKSGDAVFTCGKFINVEHNWWGNDLPNFGNGYLVEWHPFESNEFYYDQDPLKMRITLNSTTTGVNKSIPVSFSLVSTSGNEVNGVVSGLCMYGFSHTNSGEFSESILYKNSILSNYTPKAVGIHHISVSGWTHSGGSITVDNSSEPDNKVQILQINYSTFTNLQNRINNAASGSVINLDMDYAYFINDYVMEEKGIEINKNIEIDGHGHTINAQLSSRIFYSSEGTITLRNLILTQGYENDDDDGGAIYIKSDAKYTIINCTFDSNFALQDGGAIFNNGKELKVINSTFTHNQGSGASFLNDCDGGAIHSKAHLFVDGCVFEFNTAGDNGGAIYATDGLTLGNNPSHFNCNRAYAKGGAICTNKFNEDIKYASFIHNIAGHGDFSSYGGGAIYIKSENWITFSQCFFGDNECTGKGGAINLDSSKSHLTLINNIFMYNRADSEGQSVFNSGYYDKINNNWWGEENPSSNNDQLVEWKFLPWESNVYHSDSNPLKMDLVLDKNTYLINETVTATLSFFKPDGSLFSENIFDAKYDNKYLSFSLSPDISSKNIIYNKNNVVLNLSSSEKNTFKVTFTISVFDKEISLSKSFSVINLSISVPEIKDYCNNGQFLKIHLYGDNIFISHQKIVISFRDEIFEVYTDENGDASVFLSNLPSAASRYPIFVSVLDTTVESAVTVLSTIHANNTVRVFKDNTPYYAIFLDREGQFLSYGELIGYYIDNGPFMYANVENNGLAPINVGFLDVGVHYITLLNFKNYEFVSYQITVLARFDAYLMDNESYPQKRSISQQINHENVVESLLFDGNGDFNDITNQFSDSIVKSTVNNQSNMNNYFPLLLILFVVLFAGILIKNYND